MHQKYTLRVEEVEALQITAKNATTVSQFLHGAPTKFVTVDGRETDQATDADGHPNIVAVRVPTVRGEALAVETDYILRDAAGSFSVVTAKAFKKHYDKVTKKAAPAAKTAKK